MNSILQQRRQLLRLEASKGFVSSHCSAVYRVQDLAGRGPWKPGFSDNWVEERSEEEFAFLRPIFIDFPDLQTTPGKHVGVGCTSLAQLRRWILPVEYERLQGFGYQCVKLEGVRIVAASDIQCVFERSRPLKTGCKPVRLHP